VKAATRNLWIEIAAFSLVLISLIFLLGAVITTATFVVNQMLPNEPPIESHGLVVGPKEALVAAFCMIVPGIALVAAAWGLRSLLIAEEEKHSPL